MGRRSAPRDTADQCDVEDFDDSGDVVESSETYEGGNDESSSQTTFSRQYSLRCGGTGLPDVSELYNESSESEVVI